MANLRSLIVKIGADTQNIEKALATVGESAKTLDAGLKKLGTTPVGRQAIADAEKLAASVKGLADQQQKLAERALLAARGLEAVGGPARLMRSELDQVAKTVQRGLDAFRALGQQAPAELQKVAAAIQKQQQALKSSGGIFGLAGNLPGGSALVGGLAGLTGAATAAFVVASKQALDLADSLTKLSDRTGISVKGLQSLGSIARNSGNSLEDITSAVSRLQNNLVENTDNTQRALARIGLTVTQLRTLAPDQQFLAIAKGIQAIHDPAEQVAVAIDLFGKAGAEILPSLKADVDKLGAASVQMSAETVRALDEAGDAFANLKASAVSVAGEILAAFIHTGRGIAEALRIPRDTEHFGAQGVGAIDRGGTKRNIQPEDILNQTPGSTRPPIAFGSIGGLPGVSTGAAKAIQDATDALNAQRRAAAALGLTLDEYLAHLEKVAQAHRQLFGTDLIARANLFAAALGGTQNISKITAAEQKQLQTLVTQAIEAYAALGRVAPEALQRIKRELDQVLFQQEAVKSTVGNVGGLAAGAGTLFNQEEFRNIAAGFQANGDVIDSALDSMAEHARQTQEAFEQFFGVTAGLSLALPPGQTPGNQGLIREAGADADLAAQIQHAKELQDVLQGLSRDLGLVGDVAEGTFGAIATGLANLIPQFQAVLAAINSATTAMLTLNAALGVFGLVFSFGSIIARRFRGGATGGVVTESGIQHFAEGGRVLPFVGSNTDTVPAMLTPGEWILNKDQQQKLAGAMGGITVHNDNRGAFFGANAAETLASMTRSALMRQLAQNKDGDLTRLRGMVR